jgi:uncharacterized membrane protein
MADLVVVGFDDPFQADRVLTELTRLQKEHLIDLEDAVVAVRGTDDQLRIKQSVNLLRLGAASGGLWGALFGSLIGMLFLNPLIGLAAGGALGAGTGALSGKLADYGINDDFIRTLGQTLKRDTSALFLLVRKAQPEKVLSELGSFEGRILRSSLSPEQEAKLQQAIAQAHVEDGENAPPPATGAETSMTNAGWAGGRA